MKKNAVRNGMIALTALTVAAAGAAGPVAAQDAPEKKERFVIIQSSKEGASLKEGDRLRVVTIDGARLLADCADGEKTETTSGEGDRQTRVIVCRKGDLNSAEHAARLAEVLERIAQNDKLTPEQRTRISEALQRALERTRAN